MEISLNHIADMALPIIVSISGAFMSVYLFFNKKVQETTERAHHIEIELERRITHTWARENITNKIDHLERSVDRLQSHFISELGGGGTIGNINKNLGSLQKSIEDLNVAVGGNMDRKGVLQRVDELEKVIEQIGSQGG